jgi:DNA-binding GntR family transcriptional regulator
MDKSLDLIPQRTLEIEVIDRLRDAIVNGVFKSGEQLNQVQIAAQFGTSRGPVRAALSKLEEEGLVRNVPYHGTFVTVLDRKMAQDLYGLRAALEAYGAQLAASNCTAQDLAHLESIVQDMQQAARVGDTDQVIQYDLMIHQYLIDLSGNALLQQAWSNIKVQVRRCLSFRHHGYRNLEEIADSHLPLLDMLRRRDAEGAATVMMAHTLDASRNLMSTWPADQESQSDLSEHGVVNSVSP